MSLVSDSASTPPAFHRSDRSAARRNNLSLFLIGFVTFSLLYAVQPLLPWLARRHALTSADAALALSVSTAALAFAVWGCAARAAPWDRRRLILWALLLASLLNAASAFSVSWSQMLLCRALMGLCLGVVPAMAMAHVAEAAATEDVTQGMGLYVAGTAFGGMLGRVGQGVMADLQGWKIGLLGISALCLVGVGSLGVLMPPSSKRKASQTGSWVPLAVWSSLVCHPGLLRLFLCGAIASGLFVSAYNYAGFRLQASPFSLSTSQTGLIFCCYAFGVVSSSAAGWLVARWGARRLLVASTWLTALGLFCSLAEHLPCFVVGLSLMTMGFFVMHAVCSGWVGMLAPRAFKAQATALYLLSYYFGASLLSYPGGWAWDHCGWLGLSCGLLVALVAFSCSFAGLPSAASSISCNQGSPVSLLRHDHAD